jgi:predicted RNA-binding protein YlqC (UPF0109 family)
MIKFVEKYIRLLAFHPQDVIVKIGTQSDNFMEILVYANKIDTGRIIGKNGAMIKALKTVVNGCKAKEKINYKISVNINEQ